jgi:hypothetical protein
VLEGRGYDLHQDCDVEITDTYHWTPQEEVKRYEWEAGDVIYIPPNTIQQHFNADPTGRCGLISAVNRIFRYCGLNDLEQIEDAPEYRARHGADGREGGRVLQGRQASPSRLSRERPAMNDTSTAHERDRLRRDREEVRDREVTPYTRWIARRGSTSSTRCTCRTCTTVELKPWARAGGRGVFLNHDASRTSNDCYVCEIPPGGELARSASFSRK